MKKITSTIVNLLICSLSFIAYCQSSINIIDKHGFKQGVWVKGISINIIDTMNYLDDSLNGVYKSFYIKSGQIRYFGEYINGKKAGTWKFFDKGVLVAEEVKRGHNLDSIKNESGNWILPLYYSYVKLYDHQGGFLKSEGEVLYFDSWDDDLSNEHGLWKYYNSKGEVISTRNYNYGRLSNNNVR